MKTYEVDTISIDGSTTAYQLDMMRGPFVDVKKVLQKQFNQLAPFKVKCKYLLLKSTCTDEVEINKISEGLIELTIR